MPFLESGSYIPQEQSQAETLPRAHRMLSPRKPSGASPMRSASPRTAVPLNGLFINNTWRCNCPDRPPAIKLQTKREGANHGRWFWTCQSHQVHCNFFLWSNDAEVREKKVVLNNERSESFPSPVSGGGGVSTPTKRKPTAMNDEGGLLTPQTENRIRDYFTPMSARTQARTRTPYSSKSAGARMMEDDEALEQLAEDDELDSGVGAGSRAERMSFQDRLNGGGGGHSEGKTDSFSSASSGSPRKVLRTQTVTSPGKRKRECHIEDNDIGGGGGGFPMQTQTPIKRGPLFSPSQSQLSASPWPKLPPSSAEICLTPTPPKYPRQSIVASESPPQQTNTSTSLSHEALSLLESQNVVIPRSTQEELVALLDQHELRDRGIVLGRDVTRTALKQRDEEIVKLRERIACLERQKKMDEAVIGGLRGR